MHTIFNVKIVFNLLLNYIHYSSTNIWENNCDHPCGIYDQLKVGVSCFY